MHADGNSIQIKSAGALEGSDCKSHPVQNVGWPHAPIDHIQIYSLLLID